MLHCSAGSVCLRFKIQNSGAAVTILTAICAAAINAEATVSSFSLHTASKQDLFPWSSADIFVCLGHLAVLKHLLRYIAALSCLPGRHVS